MSEGPPTRPSLLIRLRNLQDRQAWSVFADVYAPLIYGYLRKRALQDADAADITQAVLRQVAAHVGSLEYDPQRGKFRSWLFTIVRNRLRDFRSKGQHRLQGSGDSGTQRLLEERPASEPEEAREWDSEYRRGLLAWAAEQIRPQVQETTWQAFSQTAIDGIPCAEVASRLGLSVAAVYLARSRVMARLRAVLREVQDDESC